MTNWATCRVYVLAYGHANHRSHCHANHRSHCHANHRDATTQAAPTPAPIRFHPHRNLTFGLPFAPGYGILPSHEPEKGKITTQNAKTDHFRNGRRFRQGGGAATARGEVRRRSGRAGGGGAPGVAQEVPAGGAEDPRRARAAVRAQGGAARRAAGAAGKGVRRPLRVDRGRCRALARARLRAAGDHVPRALPRRRLLHVPRLHAALVDAADRQGEGRAEAAALLRARERAAPRARGGPAQDRAPPRRTPTRRRSDSAGCWRTSSATWTTRSPGTTTA